MKHKILTTLLSLLTIAIASCDDGECPCPPSENYEKFKFNIEKPVFSAEEQSATFDISPIKPEDGAIKNWYFARIDAKDENENGDWTEIASNDYKASAIYLDWMKIEKAPGYDFSKMRIKLKQNNGDKPRHARIRIEEFTSETHSGAAYIEITQQGNASQTAQTTNTNH